MGIGRRMAHGFCEGRGRWEAGFSGELALVAADCRAPLGTMGKEWALERGCRLL